MSAAIDQPTPSGLRRTLGVRDLMVYGLLFIAPMAPVGVFGVLDASAGAAEAGTADGVGGRR
ncbi:Amino acid permease OS=Kitasatospora aureofaciens OX=1894 GN=GCM10010502_30430 PE=4 SV=1 [Kitasatospora aureofaciens]